MLHLESRSYNKSFSSPKAYCLLRIVDKKPSLVVSSHCLTPLNMLAYHSLWTKCTSWFASIIEPYHGDSATFDNFTLWVLVYHLFRVSTLHDVGPLSSHVVMISAVRSYIHPVLMSQRRSSSNTPMFDSTLKFLSDRGCRLNLEIWEGSFPFRASTRVVEPRRSNDEAQHKRSHGAQFDSTRGYAARTRKEKLPGRPRSLLRSAVQCPLISTTNASFIIFLCPILRKPRDKISLRGEGCNTMCYGYANHLH
jgi:hypothetical protein